MTMEAIATIGHNRPPPTPREAHVVNMGDLLIEASNWCDGQAIENDAQAEAVQILMRSLQIASDAADEERVKEKTPHDDAIDEIQGFWNPWIAPIKNKKPGTLSVAVQACQNALTAWLREVKRKQDEAAEIARQAAEVAAEAARKAMAEANQSSDLNARDEAETIVVQARQAEIAATQAERAKPTVSGFGRAASLRDNFVVKGFQPVETPDGEPTPGDTAAFRHYWTVNRPALQDALLEIARADVRAGRRSIPGVLIVNEPRV